MANGNNGSDLSLEERSPKSRRPKQNGNAPAKSSPASSRKGSAAVASKAPVSAPQNGDVPSKPSRVKISEGGHANGNGHAAEALVRSRARGFNGFGDLAAHESVESSRSEIEHMVEVLKAMISRCASSTSSTAP